ncbi:MAG: hypothetical protein PVJ67_03770 [Candidatus Pacearchaeota archaeon]|jgi:hypothetical protein
MGSLLVGLLDTIGGGGGSLPPKIINVPADFPTVIEANAEIGRIYIAASNVTDNDLTKTNTGQSFLSGEEFVWDGISAYVKLGANALWLDSGSTYTMTNARNLDMQGQNIVNLNNLGTNLSRVSAGWFTALTTDNINLTASPNAQMSVNNNLLIEANAEIDLQCTNHIVLNTPNAQISVNSISSGIGISAQNFDINLSTSSSGNINLNSAGNVNITASGITISGDATYGSTGFLKLPAGTTGERPGTPVNGMTRYNSTTNSFEFYENGSWRGLGDSETIWQVSSGVISKINTTDKLLLDFATSGSISFPVYAKVVYRGNSTSPNSSATCAYYTTDDNTYPCMVQSAYKDGEQHIAFGAYFNHTFDWVSTHATSNYVIERTPTELQLYGDAGVPKGLPTIFDTMMAFNAITKEVKSTYIYNKTVTSSRDVEVESDGTLGYVSSIKAIKKNLDPDFNYGWVFDLPVYAFNYKKKDPKTKKFMDNEVNPERQYGLLAEDVEQINNEFVFYDDDNNLCGVHYKKFIPILLKIIQDHDKRIQELSL